MSWVWSSSELSTSKKFFNLVSLLKVGPRDAFWHLHHLWFWVSTQCPDGRLDGVSDVAIAMAAQWPLEPKVIVDALVGAGFLDREESTLIVHDWKEHRPDWVRKRHERGQSADKTRTKLGQNVDKEEKRESFLSAPSLPSPTPPSIPSPVSLSKERKEEDSAPSVAALDSKTSKKKTEKRPIEHWALLVDHIKRKWEYKKRPYGKFMPTDKDFGQLRKKALVYDAFELMALYDDFIVTDDPFWSKNGYAIWVFCSAIDFLVDKTGWKDRAKRYRFEKLKPVTQEEKENVKNITSVLAQMTAGKTNTSIYDERKELARTGAPFL